MPDFDPDAYLAAPPPTGGTGAFDPDAYLAKSAPPRQGYLANTMDAGRAALATINKSLNPFSQAHMAEHQRQMREGRLQSPIGGHAEPGQNQVARPPAEQNHGGKVDDKGYAQGGSVGHEILRQHGGRVNQKEHQPNGRPKLSHLAVGYVDKSKHKAHHCGACSMFVPEDQGGPCTLVVKPIAAAGWCRRFDRRKD